MTRPDRLKWAVLVGAVGFVVGGCGGGLWDRPADPGGVAAGPLPHHVGKSAGAASLRFAMAHDVIHERFPKHGPAHYTERNRLAREQLRTLPPADPRAFALGDDLAVGLIRLGQLPEAITVLRAKLARQEAAGLAGKDLYSSYANLGTALMLHGLGPAAAGDLKARDEFRESVELIRRAVAVNPESHFGREPWQLVFGELVMESFVNLKVLRWQDFVGNKLYETVIPTKGRPVRDGYRYRNSDESVLVVSGQGSISDDERASIRHHITPIGTEWRGVPYPFSELIPFDEPVLGIIGMWRQGGGANPHFALALGEILLRVGQRYIAWTAFERAARMSERFWPDPTIQAALKQHCAERQRSIEGTLQPAEVAELRPRFDAELAYGERYQQEYADYETAKIVAGVPLSDPQFFAEFERGRTPIASVPGPEEEFVVQQGGYVQQRRDAFLGWGTFGAGVAALGTALLLRRRSVL